MAIEKTFRTFEDIYTGIFEHAKQSITDTVLLGKMKRLINFRYLQVQAYRKWKWRREERFLKVPATISGTDVDVTYLSRSIIINDTLTQIVAESYVGRKFNVNGQKEIYTIIALQQFNASGSIFILKSPFAQSTATAQSYRIIKDEFGMWPDFEELDDVVSFYNGKPVVTCGPEDLIKAFNRSPFRSGKARMMTVIGKKNYEGQPMGEFVMGQDFMGRHPSKSVRIYPAITSETYILPITFVKSAQSLVEDDDEPLMSKDDRIVLFLGGLADMYGILKDQTEVENNEARFSAKLEQMANDEQQDDDRLSFAPSVDYRTGTNRRRSSYYDPDDDDVDIITEI